MSSSDNYTRSMSESSCPEIQANEMRAQRQMVLAFNYWTLGVLIPGIAVLGILANAASMIVLTRRPMRSSPVNVYLAGLSAFDGLLLLMTLLLYPALSYCEMEESTVAPWCQYFFHSALVTYPISLIAQSASAWTLTAITVDRFIAIMWPLQSRNWCSSRRANWVLSAICLWSLLYNLPSFFELRLVVPPSPEFNPEDFVQSGNSTNGSAQILLPARHVVLTQTDLRRDPNYIVAYKGYCYLIFMLLLPAGMMIILNLFVTVSVRKAYRLRKAMSGREEKERRCTIMAVLVVATFLILNSLAFVNNLIEIFSPPPPAVSKDFGNISAIAANETECDQQPTPGTKSAVYLLLVSVGNVLVALNSATNFLIYCALGLRFRRMFCIIFCPRHCGQAWLAADVVINDRSYHSLAIRYSANGSRKMIDARNRPRNSITAPARNSSQRLVDDGLESVWVPSGSQTPAGSFSSSPGTVRKCKLKKGIGSKV